MHPNNLALLLGQDLPMKKINAKGYITEKELYDLRGIHAEDVKFIVKHLKKAKKSIDEKVEKSLL